MYTGKVKLPPNKLAIVSISEASLSDDIDQTEVNPFTDYIEFIPYKFDDEQNVPDVPDVPPNEGVLEKNLKNDAKTEKQTGTTGTCGTFPTNPSNDNELPNRIEQPKDCNTGEDNELSDLTTNDTDGYGDDFINKIAQEE